MTTVYNLVQEGSQLWGRTRGQRIREQIETLLDSVPEGGVLRIELKGVEVMDFSFSSEVFGKLIGAWATSFPSRVLVLSNPSEYVTINLNQALKALGLLALVTNSGNQWNIIGKATDTDRETLHVVARLKEATTPEIAEALNIKLTTCNQRLKKLVDSGLLIRSRTTSITGGEQYTYFWKQ
ncbi:MAG: winged helix-turn-helix transcriptional regulator [Chloroflexi bacterium]|nr:winged helix-turn-helix transcriptional regulator [Chloroflexota bacterium]